MAVSPVYSAPAATAPMFRQPDRWVVLSRTTSGTYYEVFPMPRGGYRCTCPAGLFGNGCWHARAVEAEEKAQRAMLAADDDRLCGIHGRPREWCELSCPSQMPGRW